MRTGRTRGGTHCQIYGTLCKPDCRIMGMIAAAICPRTTTAHRRTTRQSSQCTAGPGPWTTAIRRKMTTTTKTRRRPASMVTMSLMNRTAKHQRTCCRLTYCGSHSRRRHRPRRNKALSIRKSELITCVRNHTGCGISARRPVALSRQPSRTTRMCTRGGSGTISLRPTCGGGRTMCAARTRRAHVVHIAW